MKVIKYFLIFLLLTTGCKSNKDNPVTPEEKTFIIPLNVGNQWLGKAELIDTSGSIFSTSFLGKTIVGNINQDSTTFHIFQMDNGLQFFCMNTDSGFVYNFSGRNSLQYKYPAKVGDKFSIALNAYREVISIDTTITTEYGQYRCYHYRLRFTDVNFYTEEFLSPGYGYIYSEHFQSSSPSQKIFLYSRITYNPMLKEN